MPAGANTPQASPAALTGWPGCLGGVLAAPTLGMAQGQQGSVSPWMSQAWDPQLQEQGVLGVETVGTGQGGQGGIGEKGGKQGVGCQVNRRIPVGEMSGCQAIGCQGSEGMPGDGLPG